ncbi:MAG: ribbon-helix-helix domain-containing protein [Candidatus Hydrothermarchaeales archaeon]
MKLQLIQMKDDIDEIKDAQITAKIPSRVKTEMDALVKKGMFNNLSECVRTAINRFLREINDYLEEEKKKHKEILEIEKEADMEELKKFVEELGELYK